jgi:hypothetical protein
MVERPAGHQSEARKLAGLLADASRLRVASAVALGAKTLGEIGAMTGLDASTATRCLGQLAAGGLVENEATTGYRLRVEVFRDAAHGGGGPGAKSGALASLGRNGRLPRSRVDRLTVLRQLADLFEPDRRYPEAEVNSRLRSTNPDYALLRRSLVDEGLLGRANEAAPGGRTVMVYWRTDKDDSEVIL